MTKRILELARSIPREELAAIPRREPQEKPAVVPAGKQRACSMYVNEAAKAFLELKTPMRGDIKLIAAKFGISANSIWHKLARWDKLGGNDPYHVPQYALDRRKSNGRTKSQKATATGHEPRKASAAS